MHFGYTIAYVPDVAATVAFYERAFGLTRRFLDDSGHYAELETGTTTLAFASYDLATANLPNGFTPHDPDAPPTGIELAFVTEDVPSAYARAVAAGAVALVAPKTKPWGQQVGYVRDLNGVLVELGSPV